MISCGQALVDLLAQHEVETIFGIPGVHTLELYRGLAASGLRHVTPRHEQGAGFMADGWGRVSGRPGVCFVITGPGVTNVLTPMGQAYHDSKPLLIVSAAVAATDHGRGTIHDLPDQAGLTAAVTAFSHSVRDPEELPDVLARAWEVFQSGRARPVHIQVPVDVLRRPTGPLRRAAGPPPAPPIPRADAIGAAADLLHRARRPVIVLGGGAVDAGEDAIALAELLDAPIGLSINARGAVAHSHPLCLGSALSFSPVADMLLGSDGMLAVGTELSELDWWGLAEPFTPPAQLVRVDLDEAQLPAPPAIGLRGDAAATLRALADAVRRLGRQRPPAAAAEVARAREAIRWPASVADHLALVEALDRALPEDRIVTADSTQPAYAANHAMGAERPRSWLMPIGYGTLGCALPMAIGAKLAAPDRPVLALAGDGGVLFTLQELATARELGCALPLVVWNNAGYGEIRDSMREAEIPPIGTDATAMDFPAIARGFGCRGVRVDAPDELERAVADALAADVPTLIDAHGPSAGPT